MRLAAIFAKFGATERSTLFATTSRGPDTECNHAVFYRSWLLAYWYTRQPMKKV
jgi:hypothetical protein